MLGMFLADVFYSKIVDDEGENDWLPLVFPQAGRGLAL
jgi:hypothetical protein